MNAREAFGRLVAGMRADLRDYHELRALLEAQFVAALEHRSTDICDIGERITAQVTALEQRRRERVDLAALLAPGNVQASMSAIADRLQGVPRKAFEECWQALENAVRDCKTLNMRNCRLLMDQHNLMQRVLAAEPDTYAPA